ncbi:MAG: isopeptide-forming domain-containing fimbrial protein [Rhodanobacteraceae bacterium]|nr:isopeptide-forming domain-containing fimbrial protein [Rhodanobacteraceae bacterium]
MTKASNPATGSSVLAGDTITYTVSLNVTNGPTTAATVLTDTLDADLTFVAVTNNPGGFTAGGAGQVRTFTLASGAASGTYVVEYTATVNATATGTVGNSVVPSGGGDPDPTCTACTTTHSVTPQIAVTKASTPVTGSAVLAGDTITYTVSLVVSNGPTTASVVLTDTLDADLTFGAVTSAGGFTAGGAGQVRTFTLPSGAASGTYVVEYTATVNASAAGSVGNSVVPTGGGDPDPSCTTCATTHTVTPQIAASKSSNPASGSNVLAGDTITYTVSLVVSNGPTTAATVLTDTLDADLSFGAVTSAGGFTAGGAGQVRTFTLPSGAASGTYVVEYTATVNANATGTVGNSVVPAGGGDPDPICTNCTTTHPVTPQIAASKASNPASGTTVLAGDTITYTVSLVVSNGPTTAPVALTDTLDADLAFGAVTSNPGGFTPGGAGQVRTFTLPTGAASGTYVVEYTATVNANATGTVGNSVVPTGGGDPDPVCTPCTTVNPVIPQIAVSKSSNPASGTTVPAGDTITYTVSLAVTNGPTTAPTVLTDTLDADLKLRRGNQQRRWLHRRWRRHVRTFTLPTGRDRHLRRAVHGDRQRQRDRHGRQQRGRCRWRRSGSGVHAVHHGPSGDSANCGEQIVEPGIRNDRSGRRHDHLHGQPGGDQRPDHGADGAD